MEQTTHSINSLIEFVTNLNKKNLKQLIEELQQEPSSISVYLQRTEAQWERLFGAPGIDIYNHLHPPELVPSMQGNHPTSSPVSLAPEYSNEYQRYLKIGRSIHEKSGHSQLLESIQNIASSGQLAKPFIFCDGSRGVGKTQSAFVLMHEKTITLHYILCVSIGDWDQLVYRAFKSRSNGFLKCVERDLKVCIDFTGKPTIGVFDLVEIKQPLFTLGFVLALLEGKDFDWQPADRNHVVKQLKCRSALDVFFLDEFTGDTNKLRFIRNLFRGLCPTIVSSTNSTAIGLYAQSQSSRGRPIMDWCCFCPVFLEYSDDNKTILDPILKVSRPMFSHLAVTWLKNGHQTDDLDACFFDELAYFVWKESSKDKNTMAFRFGQLCLSMAAKQTEDEIASSNSLVNGHFAISNEKTPIMIELDMSGLQARGVIWHPYSSFPSLCSDILLYLCFMGGKNYPALVDKDMNRISTESAYSDIENEPYLKAYTLDYKNQEESSNYYSNPHQSANDGHKLEARFSTAMVVACRYNGFSGLSLEDYIIQILSELNLKIATHSILTKRWAKLLVPLMGPPNADQWPEDVRKLIPLLADSERTKNNQCIDFKVMWQ